MMRLQYNHWLYFRKGLFIMKKEFGRFLILLFVLGLGMLLGAAIEGLMNLSGVLLGAALCLSGAWGADQCFLKEHPCPRQHKGIHLDFGGSGRAA